MLSVKDPCACTKTVAYDLHRPDREVSWTTRYKMKSTVNSIAPFTVLEHRTVIAHYI